VIDTASNKVVGTPILVGDSPSLVAVAPDGKYGYVTNLTSNNVSVIDTASNTVAATVPVGRNPVGVGIVPPSAAGAIPRL
jgi:YVTN family beta-propeller protein